MEQVTPEDRGAKPETDLCSKGEGPSCRCWRRLPTSGPLGACSSCVLGACVCFLVLWLPSLLNRWGMATTLSGQRLRRLGSHQRWGFGHRCLWGLALYLWLWVRFP